MTQHTNKSITLKINSQQDRRELVALLADNGYLCTIVENTDGLLNSTYYVVIHLK